MHPAVRSALRQAALYTDGQQYCLVHLPPQAIAVAAATLGEIGAAFCALIADKDEVSLVLRETDFEQLIDRLPQHRAQCGFHLITFDIPLEQTLVGFMAAVSAALAQAGVPLMAYSAYERDHLLIPGGHLATALETLYRLKVEAGQ